MKPVLHIVSWIITSCLIVGCKETDTELIDNRPVAVEFSMGTIAQTKISELGDMWSALDSIGIFMIEKDQPISATTILGGADNKRYMTATGNNISCSFIPVDGPPIYYPANVPVDFIAYYPYRRSLTDYIYPIDVQVYPVTPSLDNQPEYIDLMYSNNAKGFNKNSGEVELRFRHVLSKLTFNLILGIGPPDLTNAKMSISNLYVRASLDLATGDLKEINHRTELSFFESRNFVIVVPQTIENSTLIITLPNEENGTFTWDFPTGTRFESGYNYLYYVTVSKTGIQVTQNGIVDWDGKDDTPVEDIVGP